MKKSLRLLWLIPVFAAAVLLIAFFAAPKPVQLPKSELSAAAGNLDSISIEAVFLPQSRSMHVKQRITLLSRSDEVRNELILRTYPNAFQSPETSPVYTEEYAAFCYPEGFSTGALMLQSLALEKDGESKNVSHLYLDSAKTVLSVPVSGGWQPGETITLSLEYVLLLPNAASRYGMQDGIYSFCNAFPLPARFEDGSYRTDEYYPIGDPFYSDTFSFEVTVTAPAGMECAASALPVRTETTDGSVIRYYHAPALRDFGLVFSGEYHVSRKTTGGITLQAFTKDAAAGKKALGFAEDALNTYSRLYGAYPYDVFSIAEVSMPFSGAEYPAMALLSSAVLRQGGETLERTVAHEAAHQWWYSLVGSDPINNAWQDEALAEYSVLQYYRLRHGQASADNIFQTEALPSLNITMLTTPGAPLSHFSTMAEYTIMVYNRGLATLCALDEMMQGGLNGFLRHYRQLYAFRIASREDFENALFQYSGQDYSPLLLDYLDTLITP